MYLHITYGNVVGRRNIKEEIVEISSIEYTCGFTADKYRGEGILINRAVNKPQLDDTLYVELRDGNVFRVLSDSGVILKEFKK